MVKFWFEPGYEAEVTPTEEEVRRRQAADLPLVLSSHPSPRFLSNSSSSSSASDASPFDGKEIIDPDEHHVLFLDSAVCGDCEEEIIIDTDGTKTSTPPSLKSSTRLYEASSSSSRMNHDRPSLPAGDTKDDDEEQESVVGPQSSSAPRTVGSTPPSSTKSSQPKDEASSSSSCLPLEHSSPPVRIGNTKSKNDDDDEHHIHFSSSSFSSSCSDLSSSSEGSSSEGELSSQSSWSLFPGKKRDGDGDGDEDGDDCSKKDKKSVGVFWRPSTRWVRGEYNEDDNYKQSVVGPTKSSSALNAPRTAGSPTKRQKETMSTKCKTDIFRDPQTKKLGAATENRPTLPGDGDSDGFVFSPRWRTCSEKNNQHNNRFRASHPKKKLTKAGQKRIIKICRAQRREARDARNKSEYANACAAWRTREGWDYDRLPACATETYVVQHPHVRGSPYCTLCDAVFNPQHTETMGHKRNLVLYGLEHAWVVFEKSEKMMGSMGSMGDGDEARSMGGNWVVKDLEIPQELIPKKPKESLSIPIAPWLMPKTKLEQFVVDHNKKIWKEKADEKAKKKKALKEKEKALKQKESLTKEGEEGRNRKNTSEVVDRDEVGSCGFENRSDEKVNASANPRVQECIGGKSGFKKRGDSSSCGKARKEESEASRKSGSEDGSCLGDGVPRFKNDKADQSESAGDWPAPSEKTPVAYLGQDSEPMKFFPIITHDDYGCIMLQTSAAAAHVSPSYVPATCSEENDDDDDDDDDEDKDDQSMSIECPLGEKNHTRQLSSSGLNDDDNMMTVLESTPPSASGKDEEISSHSSAISSRSSDDKEEEEEEEEEELSSNTTFLFPGLQEDDDDDDSVGDLWIPSTEGDSQCGRPRSTKGGEKNLTNGGGRRNLRCLLPLPHIPSTPLAQNHSRQQDSWKPSYCPTKNDKMCGKKKIVSSSKDEKDPSQYRYIITWGRPTLKAITDEYTYDSWEKTFGGNVYGARIIRSSEDKEWFLIYQGITVAKAPASTNSRLPPMEGWLHIGPPPFTVSREVTSKSSGSSE